MNDMTKNIVLWLVIAGVLYVVASSINTQPTQQMLNYSAFIDNVENGNVDQVTIGDTRISGQMNDGTRFETVKPPAMDTNLIPTLIQNEVEVTGKEPERQGFLTQLFLSVLPILLILAIFIFFMRQMQGGGKGGGGPMTFGKSKARLMGEDQIKTTFADVAGVEEAKDEVQELVEFLRDPAKFQRLGGKIPRGVLMVGSPGTGKTLLAKAIAGEAKVPFFSISGSDFVEMFVGVGASRVRDMFDQAKKHAPCIIFIDEIDAVGRSRGAGLGGGHDEREQTLNQLLVEMDGFDDNDGVIVIAATNRPDVLDPALLRPGRFDRQVVVPVPDIDGREKILAVHMKKVPLAPDVNPRTIARGTPGFSGADLANLVNEAALLAARRNKRLVAMQEFEDAKDKVLMGAERRSMVMTEDEKRLTAYHEAGHALVGLEMDGCDPLHKVTIIPRGRALGVTMSLPERDRYTYSIYELKAKLAMMFGGRAAEEIIFGKERVTTGAGNDIKEATSLARRMITEYGFSEKLGPLRYEDNQEEVFLGHSVSQHKNVSDATAKVIDDEIRALIDAAESDAIRILTQRIDDLHTISNGLLEYETLSAEEVDSLLRGEPIDRPDDQEDSTGSSRSSVPTSGTANKKDRPTGGMEPEPQPQG